MRFINRPLSAAIMLLASAYAVSAADFGYCGDAVVRNNIFRVGESDTQGMAIKLSHDKLQQLRGLTVSGFTTAFGSKRTTGGKFTAFVSPALDGEPLISQTFDITDAVKWVDYVFDSGYTITGDEDALYIGYTAQINPNSSMLIADGQPELDGCNYLYVDGQWVDACGLGHGNVSLRATIPDAPAFADAMLKPVAIDGYFKANHNYALSAQVFNFGTDAISDFDLKIKVGDDAEQTTHYSGLSVPQGAVYDIALPEFFSESDGEKTVRISVANVNGDNESDVSDNVFAKNIFYYPASMERGILLEGFTGQKCSNCPSGHAVVSNFLWDMNEDDDDSVTGIEVMHHSGYQPDQMSMDADYDYTYFYANPSTFAPAVMLNRINAVGSCPVMNVDRRYLDAAYDAIMRTQPYVSLGLESNYDPDSREVSVSLHIQSHNDMPARINVFNVFLVQNGIAAYQVPVGNNYTHEAVCRGVLTGNSWGIVLNDDAVGRGGSADWSTNFTLPEAIFSDYWNAESLSAAELAAYTIPTAIEDMYLVAYVGAYSNDDVNGHTIYNAVSAPLGQSYVQGGMAGSQVVMPDKVTDIDIRVVGRRVMVKGEYDSLQIYSVDGMAISTDSDLTPGIYIIRAISGNAAKTVKILVR